MIWLPRNEPDCDRDNALPLFPLLLLLFRWAVMAAADLDDGGAEEALVGVAMETVLPALVDCCCWPLGVVGADDSAAATVALRFTVVSSVQSASACCFTSFAAAVSSVFAEPPAGLPVFLPPGAPPFLVVFLVAFLNELDAAEEEEEPAELTELDRVDVDEMRLALDEEPDEAVDDDDDEEDDEMRSEAAETLEPMVDMEELLD